MENKTYIKIGQVSTYDDGSKSPCGYCKKSDNGHTSSNITSSRMTADDYQLLMDRGWRRCGTLFYKWDYLTSCCQPYTIRLPAEEFKASPSQIKVLKRFNKFLAGEIGFDGKSTKVQEPQKQPSQPMEVTDDIRFQKIQEILNPFCQEFGYTFPPSSGIIYSQARNKDLLSTKSWSCNVLIKLYHLNKPKILFKDYIAQLSSRQWSTNFQIRIEISGYLTVVDHELLPAEINQSIKQVKNEQSVKKEETKQEEMQNTSPQNFAYQEMFDEILPFTSSSPMKHKYTVQLVRAVFSKKSFEVFQKYEASIHKKIDKQRSSYERFLCQSPLYDHNSKLAEDSFSPHINDPDNSRTSEHVGTYPPSFGSYHMLHFIDGELMMVGVLDYTVNCLSSVYLYYDPKWEFLSPGTLSALREIEHVRKQIKTKQLGDQFKYYYMGYYFQECQKSVYKANFKPSFVTCPYTWNFVELTPEVQKKISQEKKPRLVAEDIAPVFTVATKAAKEKGMRSLINFPDGKTLGFMQLNKQGQYLLVQTLPKLIEELGLDLVENFVYIV